MMGAVSAACKPTDAEVQRNLRRIRLEGSAKQVFETGRLRMQVAAVLFFAAFLAVGWKLVDVTLEGRPGGGANPALVAHAAEAPVRADITDRNGVVLATSLRSYSLFAHPPKVLNPHATAVRLARILPGLDPAATERKLARRDKSFVWLHRHLTPRQFHAVNALGEPGLGVEQSAVRVYPHGQTASHVLGYTDVDGRGIAGIELAANEALSSGEPRALSLDVRVQDILRAEAERAMTTFEAKRASALVLNIHTGETLGLVSLPDFDPNTPPAPSNPASFNAVTKGIYELGSTFKLFTTAIALDAGLTTPETVYPIGSSMRMARFTIRDYKYLGKSLSVTEILTKSSNIGTARLAKEIGTPRQRDYMARMGLLDPAPVELVEVGAPHQPTPWRPINTMTIGYGYGLAVSPLQLAGAVGAVANGGVYVPPTLLRRGPDARVAHTAVFTPQTSATMLSLMRRVVTDGTGSGADVPGYRIGGKTGTAEKANREETALLSSFVGVFPTDAPRYVVFLMLDEPKGTKETHGYATGGWVAAPAVGRIVAGIAPILGVRPTLDDVLPDPADRVIMVNAEESGGAARQAVGGQ